MSVMPVFRQVVLTAMHIWSTFRWTVRQCKRITRSQWERFETVDFCAYRVFPNDMRLNDRVFAISVFFKTFFCRFNCGDIVELKDETKAVFLGVRYEAEENCDVAAVLLYFFKFISNAGTTTVIKIVGSLLI